MMMMRQEDSAVTAGGQVMNDSSDVTGEAAMQIYQTKPEAGGEKRRTEQLSHVYTPWCSASRCEIRSSINVSFG